MGINTMLLLAMVLAALATVTTARLLLSAIGLALTSAILAVLMFRQNSPLAAVFELSVCAGLIPAIFISTIGSTRRLDPHDLALRRKEKLQQYWTLPLIVLIAAIVLWHVKVPLDLLSPVVGAEPDVRKVLWNLRHVDLLGQVAVLAAGAFGVVVLVGGDKRE